MNRLADRGFIDKLRAIREVQASQRQQFMQSVAIRRLEKERDVVRREIIESLFGNP